MHLTLKTSIAAAAAVTTFTTSALAGELSIKWRYEDSFHGGVKGGKASLAVHEDTSLSSDKGLEKTLLVIGLGKAIGSALSTVEQACKLSSDTRPIPMPPRHFPIMPPIEEGPKCLEARQEASTTVLNAVAHADKMMNQNRRFTDAKIVEALDTMRVLAKNIREAKIEMFGNDQHLEGMRLAMASASLNVTSGGAQDYSMFRKLVGDGHVPGTEAFKLEGFMGEFNLALDNASCNQLICVQPAVKVDTATKKMFVQVGLGSNVTKESFQRHPLNLSIVLDVSGSMAATDNTEKSRLDWAKDMLRQTIGQLNGNDYLSIVLFDSESRILFDTTRADDLSGVMEKVAALRPGSSTNLFAGLENGYRMVSENALGLDGYENRVILVSDAGLNTGNTEEDVVLKLVTDNASLDIGLTAIGLGLNFNQEFIDGIAQSVGGNYIFVHSGKDMIRYFDAFNYLVTPVAKHLVAHLQLDGVDAKLVGAYGLPMGEGQAVSPLLNVQTLFFSEAGGAMVLEYDLN